MTEAIYKVGDIMEIESQYGMFSSDKKSRCLVLKCIKPGYEFIIYTLLVLKSDDSFTVIGVNQKDIILTAKRVGHIDISKLLRDDEESSEPDYAMFFTAATLMQAADLRNENEKLKAELAEETLKRKQAEAELDGVYHSDIVCENNKLRDESRILNEIVNGFKSTCDNCEARSDNEKLKAENKALSDTLSKSEAKAQSRLDRNEVLKRENEKLSAENTRYLQSMTCARKQMTEAAKRICEAEEHIDVAIYNK